MFQAIKRMLAVVGLVLGCMVAANAHEACEEQKGRAAAQVEVLHAELHRSDVKRTITESKVKSHAPEVAPVLSLDEDRETKLSLGESCLRAACSCTSSSHNNPYCRTTGGDCANHPGILCIW